MVLGIQEPIHRSRKNLLVRDKYEVSAAADGKRVEKRAHERVREWAHTDLAPGRLGFPYPMISSTM